MPAEAKKYRFITNPNEYQQVVDLSGHLVDNSMEPGDNIFRSGIQHYYCFDYGLFGNIKFAEILKQTSSLFNDETMVMMMLEPISSNSELWPDGFGMLHFNAGWCASDFQDAISELTGPEIPLYIVHISSVLFAKSLQWVVYSDRDLGLIIFGFAKVPTGFDESLALPESEAKAIVTENWDRAKQDDFNWLWEKLR